MSLVYILIGIHMISFIIVNAVDSKGQCIIPSSSGIKIKDQKYDE